MTAPARAIPICIAAAGVFLLASAGSASAAPPTGAAMKMDDGPGTTAVKSAPPPPPSAASSSSSDPNCAVERHVGVSDADAAAVEEVVCDIIRSNQTPGRHRIRVTKIGNKIMLTLSSSIGGAASPDKQLALSSLDEVNIAAPRLFEAAAEQKSVAETVDVNNVVGDEARVRKKRPSMVHGWLGVIGAGAFGQGAGGGVSMGLSAGSDRWSFVGDLRLAGESFNKPAALAATIFSLGTVKIDSDADLAYVSLSAGARHHLASDFSPFVGLGLGLDYLAGKKPNLPSGVCCFSSHGGDAQGKTGLAGYGELGLDLLRSHVVGGAIVFRVDAPAFMLETSEPLATDPTKRMRTSAYVPVASAGITLRF